jgi:hypothetical protein
VDASPVVDNSVVDIPPVIDNSAVDTTSYTPPDYTSSSSPDYTAYSSDPGTQDASAYTFDANSVDTSFDPSAGF